MENKHLEAIKLIEEFEALKEQYKAKKEEVLAKLTEIGIGSYFQDPNNKTVFKVKKPTGTFISFDEIGYDRTKKEGEFKGSLSKKEAEEKGFTL